MTEITDDHLEWATIDRLREMLASVHEDYKVTHTYAIFTASLCWILQRIRNNGDQPYDCRARALRDELAAERAVAEPWNLRADGDDPHLVNFNFRPASEVQRVGDLSMLDLLIAMRNATAHGDSRTVLPVNEGGWLVGQRFVLSYRPNNRLRWTGEVRLKRADMRTIGEALATRFRSALEAGRDERFVDEARTVREQIAA